MTSGRTLELLAGAILPTIFIIPLLMKLGAISYSHLWIWEPQLTASAYLGLILWALAIGALFSQWCLILFGSKSIRSRPVLRGFITVTWIPTMIVCVYLILSISQEWKIMFGGRHPLTWGTFMEDLRFISLMLIPPVAVGLRYLPGLFKRSA